MDISKIDYLRTIYKNEQVDEAIDFMFLSVDERLHVDLVLSSMLALEYFLFDIKSNFKIENIHRIFRPCSLKNNKIKNDINKVSFAFSKQKWQNIHDTTDFNAFIAAKLGLEHAVLLSYLIREEARCMKEQKCREIEGQYFFAIDIERLFFDYFIHLNKIEKLLKSLQDEKYLLYYVHQETNWFFVKLKHNNIHNIANGYVDKPLLSHINSVNYIPEDIDKIPNNAEYLKKQDVMFTMLDFICFENGK